MDAQTFYMHVSSWIKSYRNKESLNHMRRFIDNSQQPDDIKELLQKEIDLRLIRLNSWPVFAEEGERYLLDENNQPKIFTTRFAAICKLAELNLKGYNAELKPGAVFYRIAAK